MPASGGGPPRSISPSAARLQLARNELRIAAVVAQRLDVGSPCTLEIAGLKCSRGKRHPVLPGRRPADRCCHDWHIMADLLMSPIRSCAAPRFISAASSRETSARASRRATPGQASGLSIPSAQHGRRVFPPRGARPPVRHRTIPSARFEANSRNARSVSGRCRRLAYPLAVPVVHNGM